MSKGIDRKPVAERSAWFAEARFGMFIHWGLYAIPARGEWVRYREQIPLERYQAYFEEFDPRKYDPRKWAGLARRAGMKYAVLTTKHHDGFCLFDSALTDFKAANTPARRDLVREYVEAFRGEGLRVGFYHSLIDWHHPHYPVGDGHPPEDGTDYAAQQRRPEKYIEYLHGQVRELLTNYGRIDLLWFDFSYGKMRGEEWRARELMRMVHALQPGILTNNRLEGAFEKPAPDALGDISTPEQRIPEEGVTDTAGNPRLWEACLTLNNHWGYARDDRDFKSPQMVVRMLVECVSKGGNLLLNVGPTALGEIQDEAAQRLEAVGRWMERNGSGVYGCGPAGLPKPEWGRYTRKGDTLYAHVMEKTPGAVPLVGLPGKVRKARLLADGSEVKIDRPWNVSGESDVTYLHLPGATLPEEMDTVVEINAEV